MRRALLLCLAGSVLTLLASGRSWTTRVVDHGSALPVERITRTGLQLEPGLRPLALVGLAATLALLATRRWGRVVVGVAVAGCGAAINALALPHAPGTWPLLAALGGLLLLAAGALTTARGHHWAGLSAAYRTPAARAVEAPVTDKGVWDALDRGEDPTA